MTRGKTLWLIDAGYLYTAQKSVGNGYQFDYKKLRDALEEQGPIWRAYYLNAVPDLPGDSQAKFHNWLGFAPPDGPKIIVELYKLRDIDVREAYCTTCEQKVNLSCPRAAEGEEHALVRQEQKGVDVGIATLALTLMDGYETLLLSCGDGDLLDTVEHVTRQGKRFELAVFRHGVAGDLQARADQIYWLDDMADEIQKGAW